MNKPTIANKIFKLSKASQVKVPVKIGSYKLSVAVTEQTTAVHVLKRVLDECHLQAPCNGQAKCYALFERIHGVERHIHKNESILSLWIKSGATDIEFIVRLCKKSSSKLTKEEKMRKAKCAFSSWKKAAPESQPRDVTHIYEQLDVNAEITIADIKSYIAQKKVKLETPLKPATVPVLAKATRFPSCVIADQTRKIVKLESSIIKHVKSVKRLYNELVVSYNMHQAGYESERLYPLGEL